VIAHYDDGGEALRSFMHEVSAVSSDDRQSEIFLLVGKRLGLYRCIESSPILDAMNVEIICSPPIRIVHRAPDPKEETAASTFNPLVSRGSLIIDIIRSSQTPRRGIMR